MLSPYRSSPVAVLRRQRGLVQAEVASACGISPSALSAIERGHRSPPGALVQRLADLLACDPRLVTDGVVCVRLPDVDIAADPQSRTTS